MYHCFPISTTTFLLPCLPTAYWLPMLLSPAPTSSPPISSPSTATCPPPLLLQQCFSWALRWPKWIIKFHSKSRNVSLEMRAELDDEDEGEVKAEVEGIGFPRWFFLLSSPVYIPISVSSSNRSLRAWKLSLHCRMKVQSFRELEPSNGSGSWSLALELLLLFRTLPIASVNAVASASWELEAGVSSLVGLRCADPRCVDMFAGVGGWVDGWVTGFEFPELSRKAELSSTVPALIELWVKHDS